MSYLTIYQKRIKFEHIIDTTNYRNPILHRIVKTLQIISSAMMLILLPADNSHAQTQQTAESAQQFLSLLLTNSNLKINAFFQHVDIKQTTTYKEDKSKYSLSIEQVETITENTLRESYRPSVVKMAGDTRNACSTVIREMAFTPKDLQLSTFTYQASQWLKIKGWSQEIKRQDPRVVLAPPHHLDWGKAEIHRWPDRTGISVVNSHPRFGQFALMFATGDAELIDRIEYAMKFLQMSCDPTAGTGF